MIAKAVKKDDAKFGGNISGLLKYLEHGDKSNKQDECIAFGFLNTMTEQDAEMQALLGGNARSNQPYEHIILSWKEHEKPTEQQALEAVKIALKHLGCENCPAKWALHDDTDNRHIHIAVVRKDITKNLAIVRQQFIGKKLLQAVAEIEYKQGWEAEKRAVYSYQEGIGIVKNSEIESHKVNQKSQDMEAHTGLESAITQAKRIAKPIIKKSTNWQELHEQLAQNGLHVEAKKGGLVLHGFDATIKASDIDRSFSKSKLEAKLGVYVAPAQTPEKQQHEPRPIVKSSQFDEYQQAKVQALKAKEEAKETLKAQQSSERQNLYKDLAKERKELWTDYKETKRQKPSISFTYNAFKSVLAAEQVIKKAELSDKHKAQTKELLRLHPTPQRYQDWLKTQDKKPEQSYYFSVIGDTPEPAKKQDIRAFSYVAVGDSVHYRSQKNDPAFIDRGKKIDINSWKDEATRRATLQLSATKWKSFELTGSEEYKQAMIKTAVEMGLANKISNLELQRAIRLEQRLQAQQKEESSINTKHLQEFKRYAQAVDAEGYRVIAIDLSNREDKKPPLYFGDRDADGKPEAMSVDKIERNMSRFVKRHQDKRENIYYVPVSSDKHHILIDDLDKQKLVDAGYKPSVLIESSPHNFQAIITIPKQSQDERVNDKIDRALTKYFNQNFGDEKLVGRLHRAPAFQNLKEKHKREDGSFPEVQLRRAENRECTKTIELAQSMLLTAEQELKAQKQALEATKQARTVQLNSPSQAYYFFDDEIKKRFGDDQSKVDAMIAVRMGAMGFSHSDVAQTIANCSPTVRPASEAGKHDWQKYAERASSVAFNSQAHIMRDYAESYTKLWEKQLGWTIGIYTSQRTQY